MNWLFAFAFLGTSVLASPTAKHAPDATNPKLSSTQSSASSPKKQSSRNRSRRLKGRRAARKRGPSYQLHPDPERYQEIQKALADRGYFKGEVNGKWGDDSTDALKHFQADQKLPDDGKINSLSLIGLGLGPKHNGDSVTPADRAQNPAVQTTPLPDSVAPPASGESPH